MNKVIYLLLVCLVFIPLVNAEQQQAPQCDSYLPPQVQNTCGNLIMTCENCTFVNITTLYFPPSNGSFINLNVRMTKFVNTYNYTFCQNNHTGTYIYSTIGDLDGQIEQGNVCYEVTPSGTVFNNSLSIPLFLPMILMGVVALFFLLIGSFVQRKEYKIAFLIMSGAFTIFAIAFGILASRETLYGFPKLYAFITIFYKIFLITATWGSIAAVMVLMFFVVKRAFDTRGYNLSPKRGYTVK